MAFARFENLALLAALSLAGLLLPRHGLADDRFDAFTRKEGPGFAMLVMRDGKVLESDGFGYADLGRESPITTKTLFNVSSLTKQFTAAAIKLLERDRKIDLDDRITKYVPGLPEWAKRIRIQHLVHHMSGLPNYTEICKAEGTSTNADVVTFLSKVPALEFEPGSKYSYSNTGYVLLALVVEKASGVSFEEFLKARIFDPAGMNQSVALGSRGSSTKGPRSARSDSDSVTAVGYGSWPHFDTRSRNSCDGVVGDGGVITSIEDYAKWVNILRTPEGIFTAEEIRDMFQSAELRSDEEVPYGYGWALDTFENEPIIFHDGAWLGYRSVAVHFERQKLWVVLFSNYEQMPTWDIVRDLLAKHRKAN